MSILECHRKLLFCERYCRNLWYTKWRAKVRIPIPLFKIINWSFPYVLKPLNIIWQNPNEAQQSNRYYFFHYMQIVWQWKHFPFNPVVRPRVWNLAWFFAAKTNCQNLKPVMNSWPLVYPSWWNETSPIQRSSCWVLSSPVSIKFVCFSCRQLMNRYPLCFVDSAMNIPKLVLPSCQLLKKIWTRCMTTSTNLNMEEINCGGLLFFGEQYVWWSIKLLEGLAISPSCVGINLTTSRTFHLIWEYDSKARRTTSILRVVSR